MLVHFAFTREPIPRDRSVPFDDASGAVVEFWGVVRAREGERTIPGLDYEAYEPMALRQLEQIAAELNARYSVAAVRMVHRLGHVPAGEASLHLAVAASHRGEAIEFLRLFIERLKADIPIWKRAPLA
jgi:molybdopterin synthase catalytic subunit